MDINFSVDQLSNDSTVSVPDVPKSINVIGIHLLETMIVFYYIQRRVLEIF